MAVTQYIGSRYVPLFADPAEWSSTKTYEPLTIVLHQGNSFTSKQFVPVGIDIANTDYWLETGNFNAQVEQYRRDVDSLADTVGTYDNRFNEIDADIENTNTTLDNLKIADPSVTHVTVTKLTTLPIDTSVYYAQGCTCDLDGNIYVAADRLNQHGNALLYKFSSDLQLVGEPLELGTHANGIDFDSVLHRIFLYDKNSMIVSVNPDTMEIVGRTRSVSTNVNYSAVAFAPDFAVFNVTSTYDYVIFNRYGATLNALGIVHTPSAGPHNFRQDSCIVANAYYQLYSAETLPTLIRCMSVGGTYAGDFVIDNILAEFEGIYNLNGNFYIVDTAFNVYEVNSALAYTGLISKAHIASDVKPLYYLSTISTDTTTMLPVTVNNSAGNIMVEAYFDRKHPFMYYRNAFDMTCFGSRVQASPGTTGAFTVRFNTRRNNLIEASYYVHDSKDLTLYLANLRYNVGGTEKNLYINQNELQDHETLAQKIQTFMETAVSDGLDISNFSFSITGKSDWVLNNPNMCEYVLPV